MTPIQFVYFDLGGVLFNWKNALQNLAVHMHRPYEEVFAVFKKYDDDVCRGKITPNHLWEYFKNELALDITMDDFLGWWIGNFTPILPMQKFVEEVAARYKVGILSNIYSGAFTLCLKQGHVPRLNYSIIVQSCELSMVKPEAELFYYAQEKAGVPAENILFIDDALPNLAKAKELGWQTVQFEEEHTEESIQAIRNILHLV